MLNNFSFAYKMSVCLLRKNIHSSLLPIFQSGFFYLYWVIWAIFIFYILDINPLSFISFANITSCSIGWFFLLLFVLFCWCFLCCAKPLSLIRSYLFLKFLWSHKTKLWFITKNVLPMFSNQSFMILNSSI